MDGVSLVGRVLESSAGRLEPSAGARQDGEGFGATLRQAIERVNQLQFQSGAEIQQLLTGESEDLHKTLLAVQKSELAFEMLLQVRNKVVQAYQEIMRMQV